MLPIIVHMLWVYGELGCLEQRCLASFVRKGYSVSIWTYGHTLTAPSGVSVLDAREVLPENTLFLNQHGSYAGFSDLFRYAVLRKFGGLYSDVDVVAIKHSTELPATPFLVTERMRNGRTKINGNIIYSPTPKVGDLMDLGYAYSSIFPKEQVVWSEIGPSLLTAFVGINPSHGYQIMPPNFANGIDWWDCPHRLLADEPLPECHFLHLYNDMWRRAGFDKNNEASDNTLLARALSA